MSAPLRVKLTIEEDTTLRELSFSSVVPASLRAVSLHNHCIGGDQFSWFDAIAIAHLQF
ncbi:hypothetical protein ACQ4M4_04595 [Leptolyngbya sp. AN02str]|uniref:hypothetical protein n=1 Tax=Leptolyngbya sp. AN02str TaxID=3423363 RepID=UPI003D31B35F